MKINWQLSAVALLFLALNGYDINECRMEFYDIMIAVAQKKAGREDIADLLRSAIIDSMFTK